METDVMGISLLVALWAAALFGGPKDCASGIELCNTCEVFDNSPICTDSGLLRLTLSTTGSECCPLDRASMLGQLPSEGAEADGIETLGATSVPPGNVC